jgi:hypothetical protein
MNSQKVVVRVMRHLSGTAIVMPMLRDRKEVLR